MAAKRNTRDEAAMQKLFEQRSYVGGRLPEILDPTTAPEIEQAVQLVPVWEPALREVDDARPKRKARSEKVTGLQIILNAVQRDGFPHPMNQGNFLMLPKVFKALLSLEPVAVIQGVYEMCEHTIGWNDPQGEHGRREWARLPLRHFELACGMSEKQVLRGLKRALQQGYILRRPCFDSYEYGIRWADKPES